MTRYLLLLLAACRIHFDARDDATSNDVAAVCRDRPIGHDEDGDSIDDGCDVCPHVADPDQTDGDGDRVGDACDPEPANARQEIALFDPFVVREPIWISQIFAPATADVMNDQLLLNANGGAISWRIPFTLSQRDRFVTAAAASNPNVGQGQVFSLIAVEPAVTSGFYCEVFGINAESYLKFTYQLNGGAFVSPGVQIIPQIAGNRGMLVHDIDAAGVSMCFSDWGGPPNYAAGMRPAIVPEDIRIYAESMDMAVDYFVYIRTQ